MAQMEIHYDTEDTGGSGEWAGLYVDGKLVTVGDSYVAEEQALEMLGVRRVEDSAFMRGQGQRSGAAQTLEEVAAYRDERDAKLAEAARLRGQAEELRQQATHLERAAGARAQAGR